MKSSYQKKRNYKRKAPKRRVAKKGGVKALVNQVAKIVLHREAENMINIFQPTQTSPDTRSIFGSGLDNVSNGRIYPQIIPFITVGSGPGGRKGNSITPRTFQLRGVVTTNNIYPVAGVVGSSTAQCPFYLHMFVYTNKGNIFNNDVSGLMQGGTAAGTSLPFDGTLVRSTYPFNRDQYNIIKHRIFKMACAPQFLLGQSSTTPVSALADGWGNGFKMSHMFKINLPLLKTWKYNDQITNLPSNQNYWVAYAVVNCDNTVNPITTARAFVDLESVITYEDL